MDEIIIKGISAAPGVAFGKAFILDKQEFIVSPRTILENEVMVEIARLEEALSKTRDEILEIKKRIVSEMGGRHANIFDAHLLVLEDKALIDEVVERIKTEHLAAEYIFNEVLKKYIKIFSKIEDEYLRERGGDVDDVGRRVLKHLVNETKLHDFDHITEEMIIVCHDLSPSDSIVLYTKNIIAFATDVGGRTSHTAIMAKSLGVPAVVGLKDATLKIHNQDYLIVDGRKGLVVVNPSKATQTAYQQAQERMSVFKDQYKEIKDLPAVTLDRKTITLKANLELPEEVNMLKSFNAQGIGLYRTEYFYMNRHDLPTEDEQFTAYKKVAQAMGSDAVTIRTLDLGGDKFISSLQIPKDMYPFLGWRAIRFCLARADIFKTQLRAILRASVFGKVQLMYPMITGVGEFREANGILETAKDELRREKVAFDEKMPVGVMIEVPSAVMVSDLLAKEADFFSIGTNDLIQYALAVDRVNEKTAEFYEPAHPAILRLIKQTVVSGHNAGINVGLCGEMAAEPILALLLLGLGVDELSMSPMSLLQIKSMIRSVNIKDAQTIAASVLDMSTGKEVEAYVEERLKVLAPGVLHLDK